MGMVQIFVRIKRGVYSHLHILSLNLLKPINQAYQINNITHKYNMFEYSG